MRASNKRRVEIRDLNHALHEKNMQIASLNKMVNELQAANLRLAKANDDLNIKMVEKETN